MPFRAFVESIAGGSVSTLGSGEEKRTGVTWSLAFGKKLRFPGDFTFDITSFLRFTRKRVFQNRLLGTSEQF
jgi:hypothetical protein